MVVFLGLPELSAQTHAKLTRAPRRPEGTNVTVYSYDVPRAAGKLGERTPDHMYVQYDDGREQVIARGGPSASGLGYFLGAQNDTLRIKGEVTPARRNRDFGRGERVMFRGFLPGMTAQQASEGARKTAAELERAPRAYRATGTNSNSFVGDVIEPQFGVRPGDRQTWGSELRTRNSRRLGQLPAFSRFHP